MYLAKEQYSLTNSTVTNSSCTIEQLNQVYLISMDVFYEIIDFLLRIQLVRSSGYQKVKKIVSESKFLDLGYLTKLKVNLVSL